MVRELPGAFRFVVAGWRLAAVLAAAFLTLDAHSQDDDDDDDDGPHGGVRHVLSLPPAWRDSPGRWRAFVPSRKAVRLREAAHPRTVWAISDGMPRQMDPRELPVSFRGYTATLLGGFPEGVEPEICHAQTASGRLLSVDGHRHGGAVFWLGKQSTPLRQIGTRPLSGVVHVDNRLVGVGGRSTHFGPAEGYLDVYTADDGVPEPERSVELPQAAGAVTRTSRGTLLVLCETMVIEVRGDLSWAPVYGQVGIDPETGGPGKVTWAGPGPRTIAELGYRVMIGTPQGFVVLCREGDRGAWYSEYWLVPAATRPAPEAEEAPVYLEIREEGDRELRRQVYKEVGGGFP